MKYLCSHIILEGREIPNRVLIHPMEGCDGTASGSPDELTKRRYRRFSESGAGVIWLEATAVCFEGRANPRQLWLHENNVDDFKRLLDDVRENSIRIFGYAPVIILQTTHSGRYSKPYGTPMPIVAYRRSAFEAGKEDLPYRIITDEECDALPDAFGKSALLAAQAGFDGVDVKCCHGYLLNEFLSAFDRPGRYGGSFENRTALYLSCIDSAKANITSEMFVTTRLNAYDGFAYPNGFGTDAMNAPDLNETKTLLGILQNRGIELVNVTLGNPYLIPHVNRPFVSGPEDGKIGVQRAIDITGELQSAFPELKMVLSTLSYPGINAVDVAEKCIAQNKCAFAGFGRMAFAYPQFYADYLKNGELDKSKVCVKCGSCSKLMRAGTVAGCPVRDKEVYQPYYETYVGGKNA